jgi:lysophospholipase L1-like esterase
MIYGFVLCIGDSLLTGARNVHGLSVPRYVGDALSKSGQRWVGIDEGVNGETTSELLRRFYRVVRAYPEASEVVVCSGTNDAKRPSLPARIFKRNYEELLRTLAILKRRCYACLLPTRTGFGAPDNVDNDAIVEYNEIIRSVATRSQDSVSIVDLTCVLDTCRDDGIHFNVVGDKWAATAIAETIIRTLS